MVHKTFQVSPVGLGKWTQTHRQTVPGTQVYTGVPWDGAALTLLWVLTSRTPQTLDTDNTVTILRDKAHMMPIGHIAQLGKIVSTWSKWLTSFRFIKWITKNVYINKLASKLLPLLKLLFVRQLPSFTFHTFFTHVLQIST